MRTPIPTCPDCEHPTENWFALIDDMPKEHEDTSFIKCPHCGETYLVEYLAPKPCFRS